MSVSRAVLVDGSLSPPPSRIFPGTKCFIVTVTVDNKEHCGFGPTPSIAQRAAVLEAYKFLQDGGSLDVPLTWEEGSDSENGDDSLYEATPPLKCSDKEPSLPHNSEVGGSHKDGHSSNPYNVIQHPSHSVQHPSHSIQHPSQFPSQSIQRPPQSIQHPPRSIQRPPHYPPHSIQRPPSIQHSSQHPAAIGLSECPPYSNMQGHNNADHSVVPLLCKDADSVLAALLDVAQRKAVDIKFEFLFFTTEVS